MFNPRHFENSRPDGLPVLEIAPQPPEAAGSAPGRQFVPLRRTDLTGEIAGPVAALRLTQRYRFDAAQCPHPVEAVYRFPLPGDAAVTGVRVRFGDVKIQAELAPRDAADTAYRTAREEGRQAALLTREAPDVFTLQVSGIRPDEDVAVETSYVQLARPDGGGWSLRVPLTTAPRFVRADERGSPFAAGQPLALLRDPGHRFALELAVEAAGGVASPTHAVDVAEADGRAHVRLRDGEVVPDRDFVLSWQPRHDGASGGARPTLQLLLHDEPAGDRCFLALVAPPAGAAAAEPLPRELILLIDHSGSMEGAKWAAADWAVQNLLAGLTPRDTFNLGLFHDTTRWLAAQPVRADERTVRQAREFLLQYRDSGGTELGVALEQALRQPRDAAGRARHVLIVTDAQVSDAGRILALVEREASRPDRRRVGVLCIDAAPNSGLAQELAERGGGLVRFLTSDPAEDDIATALDDVLADWAAPLLANLTLEVDRAGVQAAGRRVAEAGPARSAIDLGDLPAGRAVWVAGRAPRGTGAAGGGALAFRLLADGRELAVARVPAETPPSSRPAVAALFGARRVLDLELAGTSGLRVEERLRQLGYDPGVLAGRPADQAPLYPETARADASAALGELLVSEALRYGIACSATAFVATRREAGARVAGTVAVASAVPHGWPASWAQPGAAFATAPYAAPMPAAPFAAAPPPSSAAFETAPPPMFRLADSPAPGALPAPSGLGHGAGGVLDAARGLFRRLRGEAGPPTAAPSAGTPARDQAGGAAGSYRPSGPTGAPLTVVFLGVPRFSGPAAVLFDSQAEPARLPDGGTLRRLVVRFPGGAPPGPVDPGLVVELYLDDLTSPRARIRLADLVRQGGERPLNLRRQPGQAVRLVLLDPRGTWAARPPALSVALG